MIETKTLDQFVTDWFIAYAASASTPDRPVTPNPPAASWTRAIAYADASQATVLQYMAVQIINYARAQTCTGADLDSFYLQFNFFRLPAGYAQGVETFTAPAVVQAPVIIPVGTLVQTPGASIQYAVYADASYPNYIASSNSYQIPIGQSAANAPIRATIPGTAFNVQANQLNQMVSSLSGISSNTNALAITGGQNAETDAAFRMRFVLYINSLSKATESALYQGIENLQAGIKVRLIENVIPVGGDITYLTISGNPAATGTTSFTVINSTLMGGTFTLVYNNVSGDTGPSVLAGHLATAINGDGTLGPIVTAVASGSQITLTNTSGVGSGYSAVASAGSPVFDFYTPVASLITALENPLAYGSFVAFIDDGSGVPNAALLAQALASIASIRAFGIRYAAYWATALNPPITLNVRLAPGTIEESALLAIRTRIMNFINAQRIGGDDEGFIYLSSISEQAYLAVPNLVAVEPNSVLIDGVEEDFDLQGFQEMLLTLEDINVGTY